MEFSNADGIAQVLSGAGGGTDGVGRKMGACHVHTNKASRHRERADVAVRACARVHLGALPQAANMQGGGLNLHAFATYEESQDLHRSLIIGQGG